MAGVVGTSEALLKEERRSVAGCQKSGVRYAFSLFSFSLHFSARLLFLFLLLARVWGFLVVGDAVGKGLQQGGFGALGFFHKRFGFGNSDFGILGGARV